MISTLALFASTASAAIHMVQVGDGGLNFVPSSFTAATGDLVQFNFASRGHSVAQGEFASPCQPLSGGGFYSGFINPGAEPFTITINNTEPIWIYCSQETHCERGQVGVINPPSGQTQSDFAAAAAMASSSMDPPTVQGGVFMAASAIQGGGSSSSMMSSSGMMSASMSSTMMMGSSTTGAMGSAATSAMMSTTMGAAAGGATPFAAVGAAAGLLAAVAGAGW